MRDCESFFPTNFLYFPNGYIMSLNSRVYRIRALIGSPPVGKSDVFVHFWQPTSESYSRLAEERRTPSAQRTGNLPLAEFARRGTTHCGRRMRAKLILSGSGFGGWAGAPPPHSRIPDPRRPAQTGNLPPYIPCSRTRMPLWQFHATHYVHRGH